MFRFLKERLRSFRWAFKGVLDLFSKHPNAQVHLLATILLLPAIFIFQLSTIETCIIILCIALVLSLEALNSALEYLSDRVTTQEDALIAKAKDIAAAGVLMAAIAAAIIAGLIFVPKIIAWVYSV
jgi:diacylglycerol kinase